MKIPGTHLDSLGRDQRWSSYPGASPTVECKLTKLKKKNFKKVID